MAVRDDDNNVIYANFGTRKRVTSPEEAKVERVDHSGSVLNTAATRIASMFSRAAESGRLSRGRQYARDGHVVDLDVRNGAIHGKVAGSQNQPFEVLFYLPYRDAEDLGKVYDVMARTANSMRNVREGMFNEELFDLLFAETISDVRLSCSCPDPETYCKHVLAVADRLSARIDADPTVMFAMRGIEMHNLERAVIEAAQEASRDFLGTSKALSQEERNALFWDGREFPEVPRPKTAPALEDSDMDLLRKALRAVSTTNIDLLRGVSDIEDLYDYLTR